MLKLTKIITSITLRCRICGAIKKIAGKYEIFISKTDKHSMLSHIWDCMCPECEEKNENPH